MWAWGCDGAASNGRVSGVGCSIASFGPSVVQRTSVCHQTRSLTNHLFIRLPDVAEALLPKNLEAVQSCIQAALAAGEPLEIIGGGTKRSYGRAVEAPRVLSTRALKGVVDYLPHELILVARPGTLLSEVDALLKASHQQLAFEPPHFDEKATLGGALACNLAGPRRFKAGAARDHLLGFQAVTGRGEVINGGGRVVKNVTGYDMPKLMCGSFGTLAVMTEVVVKVLPRAETERTLVVAGLSDSEALSALRELVLSPHEPSGLAHWPAGASWNGIAGIPVSGSSVTLIRLEGPAPSLAKRSNALRGLLADATLLEESESRACWTHLREVATLNLQDGERLWRLSLPPASGAVLGEALRELGVERYGYDWGGGLVWAVTGSNPTPGSLHDLLRRHGGHAQVVRDIPAAPTGEPFSPLSSGQHRLNLNLKTAFDPQRILNPGRMYGAL